MAKVEAWTFEQVGGSKKVTLSGWAAPFGRPRQGAVVEVGTQSRSERTYYPGSNEPTRHIFGDRYADWQLKGRFRDRELGEGGAAAKAAEVEALRADKLPVRIGWLAGFGPYRGFIEEFVAKWESSAEVEWTLTLSIDANDGAAARAVKAPVAPADMSRALLAALAESTEAVEAVELPLDIAGAVDLVVSGWRNAVASVVQLVEEIGTFKAATVGQLKRAIYGVAALRSAGIALRETFVAIPTEISALETQADEAVQLLRAQATVEEQIREALKQGAEVERAVDEARVGRVRETYVATAGDTWESLSVRFYGSAGRADELRDANDAPDGSRPVPGTMYIILK